MAKLYYDLINAGLRTINEVPERWREATRMLLEESANEEGEESNE